jgi:hypothetical protein
MQVLKAATIEAAAEGIAQTKVLPGFSVNVFARSSRAAAATRCSRRCADTYLQKGIWLDRSPNRGRESGAARKWQADRGRIECNG